MKKVVIIPDSFKGTMSAETVCGVIRERVLYHFPGCEVLAIPIADGGEGTVDCFLSAADGERVFATVNGPFFEQIKACYGLLDDGRTAIIEMASCAGLPLVEGRADPLAATTYGVGELMLDAVNRGCRRLILGLGGSCTNDAGTGAAAAAGIRFYDAQGSAFIPTGGTLSRIDRIDSSGLHPLLRQSEIVAMCDIDNPLYGSEGAACVFAPQKGADAEGVKRLEEGLHRVAECIRRDLGMDVAVLAGGGAAGGMGAGLAAFFGAPLKKGIETVLDETHFDTLARDADVIFTGEGRLDSQSLRGKAVIGVARRAKKLSLPVIVFAGGIAPDIEAVYAEGVSAVFSINRAAEDFSVSRHHAEENLSLAADNVLRLMKLFSSACGRFS